MEDKYRVEMIDKFICYYKNDNLHREAGPAVFLAERKNQYFYLGDEDLYEIIPTKKENFKWAKLFQITLENEDKPGYYLDGVKYEKITWESILENKQLHKDLISELPQSEKINKKPKV